MATQRAITSFSRITSCSLPRRLGILSYLLPLHRQLRISLLLYTSILGLHLLLDAAVGPQLLQSGTLGIPLLWPFSSASMGTPSP